MARNKRKSDDPVPEAIAAAPPDHVGDGAGEKEDDDEVEQEVRLVRSVVHDEFTQTSEKKEIKKGSKKKTVVTWKSACNHCDMEFLHKKTSVLKKHLNSKHPPVGKIVEDRDDHARDAQKACRDTPVVNKNAIAIDKYTRWLIDSGTPLNTSDSESFQAFAKFMDEDVTIPGRWAITEYLDKKYMSMMSKLKERLAEARRCHLTMDGWSNRRCRSSFLGATAHYFNIKKRHPESFRLCLRKFNSRHTSQNIVEMTQKILDEFGIRQKTHVIITDNGSNMRKAMRDFSKIEIQSTQLDVTRSTTDGEGAGVAQEVQDEFLPDLVLDDPLLEDDDEVDFLVLPNVNVLEVNDGVMGLLGIDPDLELDEDSLRKSVLVENP